MAIFLAYLCIFIVAFLFGSIPWGVIISTRIYKIDLRKEGSGNIGSTNALRILGWKGGVACFVLDFVKGFCATAFTLAFAWDLAAGGLACSFLGGEEAIAYGLKTGLLSVESLTSLAFLGAVWGHIFSPWLHFKGGKGIATGIGCLFVTIGWQLSLLLLLVFLVVVFLTRYISAGSICATIMALGLSLFIFWGQPVACIASALACLTVIWAHRANIGRLRAGTESSFSVKKESK